MHRAPTSSRFSPGRRYKRMMLPAYKAGLPQLHSRRLQQIENDIAFQPASAGLHYFDTTLDPAVFKPYRYYFLILFIKKIAGSYLTKWFLLSK